MRAPRDRAPGEGYPRPQQPWQCGLSDEGPPCPLGPSGWGVCSEAAACHPQQAGERWICNRSPVRGGPCAEGPGPDGACAVVHRCTPYRSLRKRRGRVAMACAVAAIGAACLGLSGEWRNELIVPGTLSAQHAHLLDGADPNVRCAQCHAAGNATLAEWLGGGAGASGVAATSAAPSQSALCMKCHEKSFSLQLATAAHNLPLEALRASQVNADAESGVSERWFGGPARDAARAIECSTCHREHHGRDHGLAAIADAACQACHQDQYASFAEGHPDFGPWPYERRTPIVFDHASHQQKHHRAGQRAFACNDCHASDATGARQLTRDYAQSCAGCHDKGLMVSLASGVALVSLPTLDVEALAAAGHDIGPWPADAVGDFDGSVPLLARLLLAADEPTATAMAALGSDLDFYNVDPEDAAQLAAVAQVATALKSLIDTLAADPAGMQRLSERVVASASSVKDPHRLRAGLTAETVLQYRRRWFDDAPTAAAEPPTPAAAAPPGTWFRDDATLSLRYKPIGHADPWMTAWLDLLADAATGPRAEFAEPILRAALAPTAPGQCGGCHSVERTAAGQLAIQWRPRDLRPAAGVASLTHFSHAAHLSQTQLRDCTACHEIESPPASTGGMATANRASGGYATDDPHRFIAGFKQLSKATCVACHTPHAAGTACTQCHRYHAE